MTDPSVVFLGNAPWSAVTLAAMAEEPEGAIVPSLVMTRVPRPAGRGSLLTPTAVAEEARRRDLPLLEVETVRSGPGLDALMTRRPDAVVVVAYGEILPPEVLGLAGLGFVNLHFSLLPRWRGPSPVQWAILAGDATTGITTMVMDAGIDTGPILEQLEVAVGERDDAGSMGDRLARLGGHTLRSSIRGWAEGSIRPRPQSSEGVSIAPKLGRDDRRVDWSIDARAIDRLVRSVAPEPGAWTTFRGTHLRVVRGESLDDRPDPRLGPGSIVGIDPAGTGVIVAAGRGAYLLSQVAPAGRRRMGAAAWARGARFLQGEALT
jgi:methionyl-tRNA formyltransferase